MRDTTDALKIDEVLRVRGFERSYYSGGPTEEPPFSEHERGIRVYIDADNATIVLVTRRGTWHWIQETGRPTARGCGVGQLVRQLRKEKR